MKTKTERVLLVLKILALLGAIGYSFECGSLLVSLTGVLINPEWPKYGYAPHKHYFSLLRYDTLFFVCVMSVMIVLSAIKALIWYRVADLLFNLRLQTPFSLSVAAKLEKIAYFLFSVWILSVAGAAYIEWLSKPRGIVLDKINDEGEFLFISGIVYIISQIFRRGVEMQEETRLTV